MTAVERVEELRRSLAGPVVVPAAQDYDAAPPGLQRAHRPPAGRDRTLPRP